MNLLFLYCGNSLQTWNCHLAYSSDWSVVSLCLRNACWTGRALFAFRNLPGSGFPFPPCKWPTTTSRGQQRCKSQSSGSWPSQSQDHQGMDTKCGVVRFRKSKCMILQDTAMLTFFVIWNSNHPSVLYFTCSECCYTQAVRWGSSIVA